MQYWLLKSEPEMFGIDDLQRRPQQIEHWDGVRNYQARNFLRDQMQVGDLAFFYHSNCSPPAIVGVIRIVRAGYPDHTAWQLNHEHFDGKSTPEKPRWFMVDVQYVRHLQRPIALAELKSDPRLHDMPLLQKGGRLSVMPVREEHWNHILQMEREKNG
ncbi:MAG: EVE domain-containing protein [Gammaproteobacteria bacterium]|nr:EVE domain-containing protein [Gammaproteobacteria bacterium]